MGDYPVSSPVVEKDFYEFMKRNPSVQEVINWLFEWTDVSAAVGEGWGFVDPEDPEMTYDDITVLEKWAEKRGYKTNIEDFDEEDIKEWLEANNYRKETSTKDLEDLLENKGYKLFHNSHDFWCIYESDTLELIFTSDSFPGLCKLVQNDREMKEQKAKEERERWQKMMDERKASKRGRGRPKKTA